MMQLIELLYESIFFREQMPQIDADGLSKLMDKIRKEGVKVKSGEYPVGELKPSQKDIDPDKIASCISEVEESGADSFPPIVISMDMYILDGHHRTLAIKESLPGSTITAYQIQDDVLAALEVFNKCVKEITIIGEK